MKHKLSIILLACIVAAAFLVGVTGAVPFGNDTPGQSQNRDRLIGVFITREPLDVPDLQETAQNMLSGGEVSLPEGNIRRYAVLAEDGTYAFEGLEGFACFAARYRDKDGVEYWCPTVDEAISDVHTGFHTTEVGDSIDMTGTIYLTTTALFYYNPVYQTATGEVYVLPGEGMADGSQYGSDVSGSYALQEELTVTAGGKQDTIRSHIEITTCSMDILLGISVLQFDDSSNLLTRSDFAPGTLPEEMMPRPDTAYMVVETHSRNAVTRELFQPGSESLSAFFLAEDGICMKQNCTLDWRR